MAKYRNRTMVCEEGLEKEVNVNVQTALSPYRDLSCDIESLKTAFERGIKKIHDLRY